MKSKIGHECPYETEIAEKLQTHSYDNTATANFLIAALCAKGYVPTDKKDKKNKKNSVSEIDMYNFLNINRKHTSQMIKKFLEINDKEGLNYLNQVMNESIDFFQRVLKGNIPHNFIAKRAKGGFGKMFRNEDDVIQFIMSNTEENSSNLGTLEKQTICSLLKIAHCINIKNQKEEDLKKAKEIFDNINQINIYPFLKDEQGNDINPKKIKEQYQKGQYTNFSIPSTPAIGFRSSSRIKDDDMILLKMISNPEYGDVEAMNDIYGKRNECKNKEEALLLLQYHWIHVFQKDENTQLKIKNIFGRTKEEINEFIKEMEGKLDPEFLQFFIKHAKPTINDGKNSESYEDAKLIGFLPEKKEKKAKKHSVEIQFNLLNNVNEQHFSHHRIYKMKATIEAIVRLQGYITKTHIQEIIHEMLQEHKQICDKHGLAPELFALGGNTDMNSSRIAEKTIFEHFKETFIIQKLHCKDDTNGKDTIYTSTKYRDRIHSSDENESFYPEGFSTTNR